MAQQPSGGYAGPFIKPEQVDSLPRLSAEQKAQYKAGLTQLWNQLESHPAGSPQHQEAQNKLRQASQKLMQSLAAPNNKNGPPRPGSQQGRPGQQQQQQTGPGPTAVPQGMSGNANAQANAQPGQQQQQQQNNSFVNLSPQIKQEISNLKVNAPAQVVAQGPERVSDYRRKFLTHVAQLLQKRDAARARGQSLTQTAQRFKEQGQPVPEHVMQGLAEAKQIIVTADKEWTTLKQRNNNQGAAEMQRQGSGSGPSQGNEAQQQPSGPQQQQPAQPPQQQQQQNVAQAQNAASSQQQPADVKPIVNQQRPPQSPMTAQQGNAPPQGAPQAPVQANSQPPMPPAPAAGQAPPQTPQSATQLQTPQNIPQQQNMQQAQQRPMNTAQMPSQQQMAMQASAAASLPQGLGPQQQMPGQQQQQAQQQQQHQQMQRPVQPLSHQDAVNQAAQNYSRQQSQQQQQQTPQQQQQQQAQQAQQVQAAQVANGIPLPNGPPNSAVGGGPTQTPPSASTSFPTVAPQATPSAATTKWPMGKTVSVDPRTTNPVAGPPARPTLAAPGMMPQPGTQRAPAFTLEGEGDHVLSKRKLDELVRQVIGGSEENGADGNGSLAPEVEETVLALADDFVDNVVASACRLAKLRASQTLDIRDLQVVLERNYGIRIPGYALDEMRTVRKFQPAAGWQNKMQAIQAGKVMGNKEP